MKNKQNKHELSIAEICDSIIEDAQNILVNQTDLTKEITLNLRDYTGRYTDSEMTKKINEEIMEHLISQEIRFYEDVCDENGIITSSNEQFSTIFKNVAFTSDKTNINLLFGKAMIDLLT